MKIEIRIGNRILGQGHPTYVIAEAGSNHNGDFDIAKKLIKAAADAGADAIKFQVFSAEKHYSKKTPLHSGYKERLYDLIKKLEIPREWLKELKDYSDQKGIIFFASPCDYEAVELLENIGAPLYKISSFELVDLELIHYIACKQKPLIISTGLANMEEIEDAYLACVKAGNENVIFLQCASTYPSPCEIMNLKSMETIAKAFNVITGLSDHTEGIHISIAAAAMGAKVIERHFTLDRKMEGPDHAFALNPDDLMKLVKQVRDVEKAAGDGKKLGPKTEEMEFYEKARRSIHAACDIKSGTEITKDMLVVKRPGYGIKPKFIDAVTGLNAKIDISEDQWITWKML
ncbi:MAG: N-acetylneuraminate synthase [Candidatus Nealsonbacteria bacterium CG07_land_8_20_14_0_80_39_13]|nr:MAG: N-acetylneuraminate synthase [Candidatus Nealsonbacteria bacterium CG07_land_8_20_14_0_80_39_13]